MNQPLRTLGTAAASLLALALCTSAARPARAAFTIEKDDQKLTIGGLIQAWAATTEKGAPNGTSSDYEFYLRRMRIIAYGELNPHVNFFVETDNPNFGKSGDWGSSMFVQDAYGEITLGDAFQLDAGMLLVPFSHHGMQGATSLLGLDYLSPVIRYPAGSNKVWRDGGIMVRGLVLDKHLEYRLGVFNGIRGNGTLVDRNDGATPPVATWQQATDPRNPKDYPRIAGRLTINLFDAEGGPGVGGMFYDGLYIKETPKGIVSTKKVLSIGGSFDWQKDANARLNPAPTTAAAGTRGVALDDYLGVAGDVFWDLPLDAEKLMSLNGQFNFYLYNHGDRSATANAFYDSVAAAGTLYSGTGFSSEVGFRYSAIEPVFQMAYYKAKDNQAEKGDFTGVYGGFNYWLYAQATNLKIRAGSEKSNGGDAALSAQLQMQLLF